MIKWTLGAIINWLFVPKKLYISLGFTDFATGGMSALPKLLNGPEQPPAPDYKGAAEATAAGDIASARSATEANRPDMYNPFGSSVWTQDPNNPDGWSNQVNLSPEQQKLFDLNNQTGQAMGEIGLKGINAAGSTFDNPFTVQDFNGAREEVKTAMLSRVTTDIAQDRDSLHSNLIAKGIPENSEAYKNAMEQVDRKETDARQQVEIQATDQAMKEHQQKVSDALMQRNQPINEVNAFMTGTQVSNPTFNPFSNQQTTQGPDYLGAETASGNWDLAGWNADVSRNNAVLGGLFSLGGAAIGAG